MSSKFYLQLFCFSTPLTTPKCLCVFLPTSPWLLIAQIKHLFSLPYLVLAGTGRKSICCLGITKLLHLNLCDACLSPPFKREVLLWKIKMPHPILCSNCLFNFAKQYSILVPVSLPLRIKQNFPSARSQYPYCNIYKCFNILC